MTALEPHVGYRSEKRGTQQFDNAHWFVICNTFAVRNYAIAQMQEHAVSTPRLYDGILPVG